MHTEQTTNFSVRVAFADLGLTDGRRGLDAVAASGTRPASTTGCGSRSTTALPLVLQDRWDAAVAADARRREQHATYTLGGHHVPPAIWSGVDAARGASPR